MSLMHYRRLAGLALLFVACIFCACQSSTPVMAPEASADGFHLVAFADPSLGTPPLSDPILDIVEDGQATCVRVSAAPQEIRSLYFELHYDALRYTPVAAELGAPVAAAPWLTLALLDQPGCAYFGAVQVHPQQGAGYCGGGVLATLRFARRAMNAVRTVSKPPLTNASSAFVVWQTDYDWLEWVYSSSGDNNQNGMVGVTDLTPLGINFGAVGPFPRESVLSLIDGDNNGILNISDVAVIGINYGCDTLGGYTIYADPDKTKYPAANTVVDLAPVVRTVAFGEGLGDPAVDRLSYGLQLTGIGSTDYVWLRPNDALGTRGTPSNMVRGNPVMEPDLALVTAGVSGTGVKFDPYILHPGSNYQFSVVCPFDGDVSTSSSFVLESPLAGEFNGNTAVFTPSASYTKMFWLRAIYRNTTIPNWLYCTIQ